jgi:5-methylcytosine-specific restriction endonuclease McrA
MALTTQELSLFWQRTQEWYDAVRREARAAGAYPSYSLEELRTLVEKYLGRPRCPYCQSPLTVATMALAHRTPIVRGGRYTLRNLEICCPECQLLRGLLDAQEYRELRLLVNTWPRPIQKRLLAGLRAMAESARSVPPVGTLEWFTGSDQPHAPRPTDPRGYKSRLLSEESCHEVSHG